MQIQDLLKLSNRNDGTKLSKLRDFENPLRENNVLDEATILDIRYIPLSLTVGILIDLRTGTTVNQQLGNTAIFIFRNVLNVQMLNLAAAGLKVLVVGESTVSADRFILVQLHGMIHGNIQIMSGHALFLVGTVDNIGSVAEDASDEEAFLNTIPQWQSKITITAFSSLTIPTGDHSAFKKH